MADKENEKIFKNAIRNEAYTFLKDKGYNFYVHSRSISQMTYTSPIVTNGSSLDLKKTMSDGYFNNAYNAKSLLEGYNSYNHDLMPTFKIISKEEEKLLKQEFFIHCYNKYPEYQKLLLSSYLNFKVAENISKEEYLFDTIDSIANNKKEKAQVLAKFPISTLYLGAISLDKVEEYLKKNGFTDEEFDKYMISYLKSRKNQLKDAKDAEVVKNYLLSKYQDEALKPYCDFFPLLKSLFELPPVDFIKNNESLSTVVIVESKKMKTSFLLGGWDVEQYHSALNPIIKAFKTKYNLSKGYNLEYDKAQKIEQVIFLHDNPEFTKQFFEEKITKYFRYMQQNVDTVNKKTITSEDFLYYLDHVLPKEELYKKLSQEVNTKDKDSAKKNKL